MSRPALTLRGTGLGLGYCLRGTGVWAVCVVVAVICCVIVVCCPFLGCFVYLGLLVGIRYARRFLLKGGRRPPGFCSVRNNLSTSGFNLVVSLCRHRVALPCLVLPCSNSSRYLPLFPVRYLEPGLPVVTEEEVGGSGYLHCTILILGTPRHMDTSLRNLFKPPPR